MAGEPNAPPVPATLRSAFMIAWPASLAAIITPLLGLIDAGVIARGAGTEVLAATSLAATAFSFLYWTLGFIRMSLAGLSAQALGRGDEIALRTHLFQGLIAAGGAGLLLVVLALPIARLAEVLLTDPGITSPAVVTAMGTYILVRVLAAPMALMTTALLGWLSGQGRTRELMVITGAIAACNTALSILLVLHFRLGIGGLAAATALAETIGFLLAATLARRILVERGGIRWSEVRAQLTAGLGKVLALNRDIFIRTLILTVIFASFTKFGARLGDDVVAMNHVLMSLVLTTTLLIDGIAIAAEALVGQALGSNSNRAALFAAAWRQTSLLAVGLCLTLALIFGLFGSPIFSLTLGNAQAHRALIEAAQPFIIYLAVAPLVLGPAFHLDGVFIGATRGGALRNAMVLSGAGYFLAVSVLIPKLGNHGLWISFLLFMVLRAGSLLATWPRFATLTRDHAPPVQR